MSFGSEKAGGFLDHVHVASCFNAVPPEGPKDHSRPNIHFQPFSEISSDCRVMMLCTADDEIFYVEEHYSETHFFADL